jgi:iron-sulfur cluster assembly protein
MLAITETAAEAIKDITLAVPDVHGLRLDAHPTATPNGHGASATIGISAVSEPDDHDEVVEEHGARVFLDQSLADYLEDKVLDIEFDDEQARFVVAEQT